MYQVWANNQKYWEPVESRLEAMAVYMAALEEFGHAVIKPLMQRSELGENGCE